MRTLMLAENLPFPTFKGGDLRNWQNLNALSRLGEVGVFGLCSNDRRVTKPRADIGLWQSTTDPALAFPLPAGRTSVSSRWLLDAEGHPSDMYYSDTAACEIERAIAEFQPDVVVVERLWLHRYIAHARRFAARIVLDDHNVEAALCRQLASAAPRDKQAGRKMRETLALRTEAIERKATRVVDQIWVCSGDDRHCVEDWYQPLANVHVIPNGVDVENYAANAMDRAPDAASSAPVSIIFPAMFTYAPNATAAQFLIDELMPLINGDCHLVLAGSMPTPAMLDASRRDKRIIVTGTVPDIRPYLQAATVMVVPLFEGSGTRFKILEGFAARVPVITTPVGAGGLDVERDTHVLMAQSSTEFATAIKRLCNDPGLVERLTGNGHDLVTQRYSWHVACSRIADAIAQLEAQDCTS